jgi:hypothetical protein
MQTHTYITHNKYTVAKNRITTTTASISINNNKVLITMITNTPFNKYLKTTGAITPINQYTQFNKTTITSPLRYEGVGNLTIPQLPHPHLRNN